MDSLVLIGAVQAFFLASLFISRKKIIHEHKVLIIFFLINGLLLLDHYLEISSLSLSYPHLIGLTYPLPLILGPVLYYYTRSISSKEKIAAKGFFMLHGIPFLLLYLFLLFDFYFLSAGEKLAYYQKQSQEDTSAIIYLAEFFLNFSVPIYSLLSLLHIRKYRKSLANEFSFTETIDLQWLNVILYFFMALSLISLSTHIISDLIPLIPFSQADNLLFLSLSIAILFIGYYGIKQKAIYPTPRGNRNAPSFTSGPDQVGSKILEVEKKRLEELLNKQKLFLRPRLSLDELAGEMEMSSNQLSQLINEGFQKSFYDLINEMRVSEVQAKMEDPDYAHLSLLGIGLESGFNSKSSFNLLFKKFTGLTPSQYKKSISEKKS